MFELVCIPSLLCPFIFLSALLYIWSIKNDNLGPLINTRVLYHFLTPCQISTYQLSFITSVISKCYRRLCFFSDVYLAGTVMLIFGMGLYGLFISNVNPDVAPDFDRALKGSSLFGMFALKVLWLFHSTFLLYMHFAGDFFAHEILYVSQWMHYTCMPFLEIPACSCHN